MELYHGDCLDLLPNLPASCCDLILTDLPYGTTHNKWDTPIDLIALWREYRRVCPTGVIALFGAQPFSSILITSNLAEFRYEWIWEKTNPKGFLNANRQPLRAHENVLIFGGSIYNPQKTTGHPRKTAIRRCNRSTNYGKHEALQHYDSTERFPRSVIVFPTDQQTCNLHPTQKPVALLEYLIRTYTHEGMTVLDSCMGSGSTGVACRNTGRNFIGMEKDSAYFAVASQRLVEEVVGAVPVELNGTLASLTESLP